MASKSSATINHYSAVLADAIAQSVSNHTDFFDSNFIATINDYPFLFVPTTHDSFVVGKVLHHVDRPDISHKE